MFKNLFCNKTVLIAEDDPYSLKLLGEYLSITGATILHAGNGIEAVNFAFKNSEIDLILMDIKLPQKDGIQATKEIREFNKQIPIIAQTAVAMNSEIINFNRNGFNDYITKPYTRYDVLKKVQKFLIRNLKVIV